MPTKVSNKSGKEDRFTYRTSFERGRKIRQRALDLSEPFESVIDRAIDRFFKDNKTASLEAPKNNSEAEYCRRLLKFLRDRHKHAVCYKDVLDLILRNY